VSGSAPPRIVACPACGKSTAFTPGNRWRPFCSERCRVSDLGAWATESYRIPTQDGDEDNKPTDDPADRLK
jgi:endogenous inhibitor of DNA gyrase (YacG/DUF329 family)